MVARNHDVRQQEHLGIVTVRRLIVIGWPVRCIYAHEMNVMHQVAAFAQMNDTGPGQTHQPNFTNPQVQKFSLAKAVTVRLLRRFGLATGAVFELPNLLQAFKLVRGNLSVKPIKATVAQGRTGG